MISGVRAFVYLTSAVIVVLLAASVVLAQGPSDDAREIPNLEGEWTVYIEEMCFPDGYGAGQGTLIITQQIGGAFEGYAGGPGNWDQITGAIARRQVRFSDVDYRDGFIDDMSVFTGELYGLHRIVGTTFHWDIDEAEGSCTGRFEALRDPLTEQE